MERGERTGHRPGPTSHALGKPARQPEPQTSTHLRWPKGVPFDPRVLRLVVRRTSWPKRLGRVAVRWQPGWVLCDYDRPRQPPAIGRLTALCRLMALHPVAVRYSKTRRGWHVVIRVRERLTLIQSVTVQAILGSDPFREAFNFARARTEPGPYWASRANILFEQKVEVPDGEARQAAQGAG